MSVVSGLQSLRGNENPVASSDSILNKVLEAVPTLEVFNSSLVEGFGSWGTGFCCGIYGPEKPVNAESSEILKNIEELDLSNRGIELLPTKGFNSVLLPRLLHVNLRGNPLSKISSSDLNHLLKSFPRLNSIEVDIPGPLGNSAVQIAEVFPGLVAINGVSVEKILKQMKDIVDGSLKQRFSEWSSDEPLAERVLRALWLYAMTYRLADEEKLDKTPIWLTRNIKTAAQIFISQLSSPAPKQNLSPFTAIFLNSRVHFEYLFPPPFRGVGVHRWPAFTISGFTHLGFSGFTHL